MTKLEKLLDAIAVCEQNGTLWTHVKVADLKEVLASAPSGSAGPEPKRCSNFSPQFGQCVYNSDHKRGHLYAQPAEG